MANSAKEKSAEEKARKKTNENRISEYKRSMKAIGLDSECRACYLAFVACWGDPNEEYEDAAHSCKHAFFVDEQDIKARINTIKNKGFKVTFNSVIDTDSRGKRLVDNEKLRKYHKIPRSLNFRCPLCSIPFYTSEDFMKHLTEEAFYCLHPHNTGKQITRKTKTFPNNFSYLTAHEALAKNRCNCCKAMVEEKYLSQHLDYHADSARGKQVSYKRHIGNTPGLCPFPNCGAADDVQHFTEHAENVCKLCAVVIRDSNEEHWNGHIQIFKEPISLRQKDIDAVQAKEKETVYRDLTVQFGTCVCDICGESVFIRRFLDHMKFHRTHLKQFQKGLEAWTGKFPMALYSSDDVVPCDFCENSMAAEDLLSHCIDEHSDQIEAGSQRNVRMRSGNMTEGCPKCEFDYTKRYVNPKALPEPDMPHTCKLGRSRPSVVRNQIQPTEKSVPLQFEEQVMKAKHLTPDCPRCQIIWRMFREDGLMPLVTIGPAHLPECQFEALTKADLERTVSPPAVARGVRRSKRARSPPIHNNNEDDVMSHPTYDIIQDNEDEERLSKRTRPVFVKIDRLPSPILTDGMVESSPAHVSPKRNSHKQQKPTQRNVRPFVLPPSACLDPEADDHPMRPNPKRKTLEDNFKDLVALDYKEEDFDVRKVELKLGENLHPIPRLSLHTIPVLSTHVFHQKTFGFTEREMAERKAEMMRVMNDRHLKACLTPQPVTATARHHIPPGHENKYRLADDPLGATFRAAGKVFRKRPIPGAEWPRGLPHPEFMNGSKATIVGAAYIRLPERLAGASWEKVSKGVPDVLEANPQTFCRPQPTQPTIEEKAKRELQRLAPDLDLEQPTPPASAENSLTILYFDKPDPEPYGAFLVKRLPCVTLPGPIEHVGQIAQKFYSGLELTPEQQQRYQFGDMIGGRTQNDQHSLPLRQIPDSLFDKCNKDPINLFIALTAWLEMKDKDGDANWKFCHIPVWRALGKSFINPAQEEVYFDEWNTLNLISWLHGEKVSLPTSDIAVGLLTIFAGRKAPFDLATTDVMMNGGEKLIAIVRRQDEAKRQELERWLFASVYETCEAAHRHDLFFYDIRWLVAAGINVFFHLQQTGDIMIFHNATWQISFSLSRFISTSWFSGHFYWLWYFARRLMNNAREECRCNGPSRILSKVEYAFECWDQRRRFRDDDSKQTLKDYETGSAFSLPCLITDPSLACFECQAEFETKDLLHAHNSLRHGSKSFGAR